MTDAVRDLSIEAEAARRLSEDLAAIDDPDLDLIHDMIEGSTNLFEAIDRVVAMIREDEAIADGIVNLVESLRNRKIRIKARAGMRREAIATAMEAAGIDRRQTPAGTVTARAVPPKALITEEASIPARFWRQAAPELDKAALTKALRDGERIEGATLSNGSRTVMIRT